MNVLLIDDHPLILAALQAVICGLGSHVKTTGVGSARAARDVLAGNAAGFDLILLDLQLADADGFDLLSELRAAHPMIPIVVVSASDHRDDVLRAIDRGAMGFIPKFVNNETLFGALTLVMAGGIYVPPMIMRAQPPAPRGAAGWNAGMDDAPGVVMAKVGSSLAALGLTPRQTDVLALLLQGQSNKLIARELNLSVETIKDHVAAVLRTLNVNSRTKAVLAISEMSHESALQAWRGARLNQTTHR